MLYHFHRHQLILFIISISFSLLNIAIISSFSFKISKSFGGLRLISNGRLTMDARVAGSLANLRFDNRNLEVLPVDCSNVLGSRSVKGAIFSTVVPTPVKNPILIAKSSTALNVLGIDSEISEPDLAEYLGGNLQIPGGRSAAQVYCGFQFGSFAGQLGDGAAIYLGEIINPTSGERWELQLKGAGKTPFSRTADGRKVLRSSVREFLCSEGMYFLNIPTTRAATCVTSDTTVERDPLYNGSVIDERCTVVSRIAPNFFRFGSFEIFLPAQAGGRAGPSAGDENLKKRLLDHILLYYPELEQVNESQRYLKFYEEIIKRTAKLVASWQATGFVHGVLNTDNMSVMGITIDYGPFGFMEHFDPEFVPNGSDSSARYSYKQQPSICKWNLEKFGEALHPLLSKADAAQALSAYDSMYANYYEESMRKKFGFSIHSADPMPLVKEFFEAMEKTSCDFTDAFVALTECSEELYRVRKSAASETVSQQEVNSIFDELVAKFVSRSASPASIVESLRRKMRIHRLQMDPREIQQLWALLESRPSEVSFMFGGAPVEAIRAEIAGEKKKLDLLVASSQGIEFYQSMAPATKQSADRQLWQRWVSAYRDSLTEQSSVLTASESGLEEERIKEMREQNPTFVLRNWIAQDAIEQAEKKGDFSAVQTVLRMLETPFEPSFSTFRTRDSSDEGGVKMQRYLVPPPAWAESLICTCSS